MVERRDRAPLPALSGAGAQLAEAVRAGLARCGVAPEDRLIVAASGGIDSMTLGYALVEVNQPIVLAHIDHGLRDGSDQDGAFVERQAARLGIEAVRIAVTVEHGNVQGQARRARYAALADAARQRSCRFVVTGHTATDQAETVLMALVRGAGLRGLAGMPERRPLADGVELARPMLRVSRAEVEAAAATAGLTWREDPSNGEGSYRRNRLRHTVLPLLREEGGAGLDVRIAASAQSARGGLDLIHYEVPQSGPLLPLDAIVSRSADAQRVLLAEALARWAPDATRSAAVVERVRQLVDCEVGAQVTSGRVRVWRERDALRIEPVQIDPARSSVTRSRDIVPDRGEGTLTISPLAEVPTKFGADPYSEIIDLDQAKTVSLRLWQDGDRIRPLGLEGSTLVSDLLRQRGVPRALRAGVPVVVRGAEVVWVVGHRLAASVALGSETTRAARWTWRPPGEAG